MKFKQGDKVSFFNQTGEGTITGIVNAELVTVDMGDGFEIPVLIKELIKISPDYTKGFEGELSKVTPPRQPHPDPDGNRQGDPPHWLTRATAKRKETKRSKNHYGSKKDESKYRKKLRESIKKKHITPEEIDLHIEELIDDHTGLSNAEIIKIQLDHFRKFLDNAIVKKKKKIIIIHGTGEGVLRYEIRKILKACDNITFCDASYQRYGYGATEVII